MTVPFPFTALVAQDQLKLALLLNAIDPAIGGVLIRGHKGTAKSTAVRALAALLPAVEVVVTCPYSCGPGDDHAACPAGAHDLVVEERPARLVELPVGATEDRVVGSLDLEQALTAGARAFEPGLLARAHRGVLYVDEVNLLNDHLVDLLLDAAAMGRNHVEREGVSISHPARFLLVGTMNPEEGELRPQLLDRFGLTVAVSAPTGPQERAEVVRRRLAYEADPAGFAARYADEERATASELLAARARLPEVELPEAMLERIVAVCAAFEVDGLRADIVIAKTARALAAFRDRTRVERDDVRTACLLALPHRRRRGPFEQPGLDEDELDRVLGEDEPDPEPDPGSGREPGDGPDGRDDASPGRPAGDSGEDGPGDRAAPDRQEAPVGHAGEVSASGQPGDGDDAGGGDAPAEVQTEVQTEVQGVGSTFTPPLLTVPGLGAGAAGRRSQARVEHGAAVGARPRRSGDPGLTDLAIAATVRAAAPHQAGRGRSGPGLVLRRDDLRRTVRQGREGNLVVFAVDASGSMAARRRMVAVKGAIRSLLLDAYQRRDRVALVTFRGAGAELVLPPTSSTELADRRLADLPTGGRTPVAAGLERTAELLAVEGTRDPERRPLVVVLTDGRANAGPDAIAASRRAGAGLAARGIASVVVDTEEGAVRLGLARELAAAMLAPCLRLDEFAAAPLAGAVRRLTGRAV